MLELGPGRSTAGYGRATPGWGTYSRTYRTSPAITSD